jgi:release factor glutamine methyltransferase
MLTVPGVYRPQGDTWLLAEQLRRAKLPARARVLDVGTGTGALALSAARSGAAEVLAVDVSPVAVLLARLNARLRGLPVTVRWGGLDAAAGHRFDLVVANPPYVPSGRHAARGRARAWDAGPDGRAVLDPLCRRAPELLTARGTLMLVQSTISDTDATLRLLRDGGLHARVIARRTQPFGPVLLRRAAWLARQGLISPGQCDEELVVVRADRTG